MSEPLVAGCHPEHSPACHPERSEGSRRRQSNPLNASYRPGCHPELPFTSHKRGIDETWRSAFQTAAKDLVARQARPFAALKVTGILSQLSMHDIISNNGEYELVVGKQRKKEYPHW